MQADARCRAERGSLVTINNNAELDNAVELLAERYFDGTEQSDLQVWLVTKLSSS